MYIFGHGRLCVSVCLFAFAAFQHYCTDADVSWGMVGVSSSSCSCALLGADLQSVHGFSCYDNIAPNAKCWRVLVLAVCLVGCVIDGTVEQRFEKDRNNTEFCTLVIGRLEWT